MLLLRVFQVDQILNESFQLIVVLVYLSFFTISIIEEYLNLMFKFINLQIIFYFFRLFHQTLRSIMALQGLYMAFIKDNS